jgi:hypothetical protein
MSATGSAREWHMFLGTRTQSEGITEVQRLIRRLDDAYDAASYVLKLISGCPGGDAEETLRIGRKALDETIDMLDHVRQSIGSAPDAA